MGGRLTCLRQIALVNTPQPLDWRTARVRKLPTPCLKLVAFTARRWSVPAFLEVEGILSALHRPLRTVRLLSRGSPGRGLRQEVGQEAARVRLLHRRHLLRGARGHHSSARVASLGADVDDVV